MRISCPLIPIRTATIICIVRPENEGGKGIRLMATETAGIGSLRRRRRQYVSGSGWIRPDGHLGKQAENSAPDGEGSLCSDRMVAMTHAQHTN